MGRGCGGGARVGIRKEGLGFMGGGGEMLPAAVVVVVGGWWRFGFWF